MTKQVSFLSVLFSLFLISSCHYISKKASCCKKSGGKYHQYKQSKCKTCSKDKKTCAKCEKKAYKKDCCGKKDSSAGFSSIKDLNKGKITGSVFFERAGRYEVKVTANIKGLSPNKKFGFHVHEFGTCDNKGLLAGGHLNPWGAKHSGPQARDRHLGDLGNLESDQKGTAVYSVSVKGKLNQFMGRSLIIHAKADDMKSQPTGNSGDRIACGVITASMPPVREEKQAEPVSKNKTAPVEKAVSSKKPAVPVEKAVSRKKPAVPAKAVLNKGAKVSVKKAVSSKKPEIQKTSGVKTETSQTSSKK